MSDRSRRLRIARVVGPLCTALGLGCMLFGRLLVLLLVTIDVFPSRFDSAFPWEAVVAALLCMGGLLASVCCIKHHLSNRLIRFGVIGGAIGSLLSLSIILMVLQFDGGAV